MILKNIYFLIPASLNRFKPFSLNCPIQSGNNFPSELWELRRKHYRRISLTGALWKRFAHALTYPDGITTSCTFCSYSLLKSMNVPVEVPHANSVSSSSVEHRPWWVECYLVDLTLALCKGYCARGGACTCITWNHLPRRSEKRESNTNVCELRKSNIWKRSW